MKNRTFIILLIVVISAGVLCTAAHFGYAAKAYKKSSIIAFIAGEKW